ncbi:TPA: hypothetical protein N0F65_003100 [Lagenidium giganteum]|uniref:Uncharacterized protein n=1 Tax=Lagenidium giganteum TaxID=4803 RepID=A0AAV2Z033_9STRA|nr:TPA: hypothetical protein N0F65_003100 [Lagenidium giganteum]
MSRLCEEIHGAPARVGDASSEESARRSREIQAVLRQEAPRGCIRGWRLRLLGHEESQAGCEKNRAFPSGTHGEPKRRKTRIATGHEEGQSDLQRRVFDTLCCEPRPIPTSPDSQGHASHQR